MNTKNCGRRNVRKNREIKGSDKYTTLDILLKFGSLVKMRIKSSAPKHILGRPGKGLITSLGIKAKTRPKKHKKERYAMVNVSMNYVSKIIREFEKLSYKSYERRRSKHEPTDTYFYLAIQLAKCMMRADTLNFHVYPVRMEMTGTNHILILQDCSTDKSES